LPLCPPSDHPASHAIVAASTVPAPRDQQASCIEGETGRKKAFKRYPIGYFHIDIAEVRTEEGKLHLFVAIDRTSKFAFATPREG
jgi:hypothetical protein